MTVDFAKEYLLDDCADCPENKDGECMTQSHCFEVKRMAIQALEQTKWVPVKWHEITDEEREREGYPEDWLTILDCSMPNDDEEILVTIKGSDGGLYVEKDICYVDDGYSLDGGYDWIDDVVAWCELPQPYVPDINDGKLAESEEV